MGDITRKTLSMTVSSEPSTKRRPPVVLGAALLSAGLIAAVVWLNQGQRTEKPPKAGPEPAHVVTQKLDHLPFRSERRFTGEVFAVSDAALTAAEEGRVRKVHVVEGSHVKPGQLLVELDDSLALAELAQARASRTRVEAERDYAEREAQRYQKLEQANVVSSLESDRQESQAVALSAESEAARATANVQSRRVARHRIVAPFAGTIARRLADPGDWLKPGDTALELITDKRLEVLVHVPADLLDQLPRVKGTRLVYEKSQVEAEVSSVVNALDRATRTALLRVEPKTTPPWLRAGLVVSVLFEFERRDGVTLPRDALIYGIAGVKVVRVKQGAADIVDVTVQETSPDSALVEAGALRPGDEVIVRGGERLRPGQSVVTGDALVPKVAAPAKSSSDGTGDR